MMTEFEDRGLNDPPTDRRTGLLWILLAAFGIVVAIVIINGFHKQQEVKRQAELAKKTEVVLWLLEHHKLFGFAETGSYTWSRVFQPEFAEKFEQIDLVVQNSGLPSLNTSEALNLTRAYLKVAAEQQGKPASRNFRKPMPDFAFINYGIDNLWNLHAANIFSDPDYGADFPRTKEILSQINGDSIEVIQKTSRRQYYEYFNETKSTWDAFFENFEDPLLQAWVTSDLQAIVKLVRAAGAEPVLLTYCCDIWPPLNDLIRAVGKATGATVIDLEHQPGFYHENGYAASAVDNDYLELNERGYRYLGELILEKFTKIYDQDYMSKLIEKKKK